MNRKYIPVYMEIVEFESEDIITTSGADDDISGDDGEGDFGWLKILLNHSIYGEKCEVA